MIVRAPQLALYATSAVVGVYFTHEHLAALGAFMTGFGGVVTSVTALKLARDHARRRADYECEDRLRQLRRDHEALLDAIEHRRLGNDL